MRPRAQSAMPVCTPDGTHRAPAEACAWAHLGPAKSNRQARTGAASQQAWGAVLGTRFQARVYLALLQAQLVHARLRAGGSTIAREKFTPAQNAGIFKKDDGRGGEEDVLYSWSFLSVVKLVLPTASLSFQLP